MSNLSEHDKSLVYHVWDSKSKRWLQAINQSERITQNTLNGGSFRDFNNDTTIWLGKDLNNWTQSKKENWEKYHGIMFPPPMNHYLPQPGFWGLYDSFYEKEPKWRWFWKDSALDEFGTYCGSLGYGLREDVYNIPPNIERRDMKPKPRPQTLEELQHKLILHCSEKTSRRDNLLELTRRGALNNDITHGDCVEIIENYLKDGGICESGANRAREALGLEPKKQQWVHKELTVKEIRLLDEFGLAHSDDQSSPSYVYSCVLSDLAKALRSMPSNYLMKVMVKE